MRTTHAFAAAFGLSAISLLLAPAHAAEEGVGWAYPRPEKSQINPVPPQRPLNLKRVPNSTLEVTFEQAQSEFDVPDWHPDDHPPAPDLILRGRRADVEACGHCHLPNGLGTTILQAPGLAGLSAAYITQQIADFKTSARKAALDGYGAPRIMTYISKTMSDADIKVAADYFASLRPKPWFRVVESTRIPAIKRSGPMYVTPAMNRLAHASSNSRRIWSARSCAIPNRALWLMCRPAASSAVKYW